MTGFGYLNRKFPSNFAISIFMSCLKLMLSRVEHEKSFITSGPGWKVTELNPAYFNTHLYTYRI